MLAVLYVSSERSGHVVQLTDLLCHVSIQMISKETDEGGKVCESLQNYVYKIYKDNVEPLT